ncbi:inositol monophosphatase family protein [Streptomyces sp. KAI-26]|uniref:inositol monophosphatase family protein n=1 Tax=Streptomyces sp. KAI-26 TaxID=1169747 RepID=UPI00158729F2|nr:inositol monophosphatase family protein [Streptomyces sp. KAI-26]NUV87804.1 inositol monophosphatase family protein [Streptomyces sp. KAI-26]NUW20264.1 inositol monophosphatase family protein [Streptomyces roseoviolaceus]
MTTLHEEFIVEILHRAGNVIMSARGGCVSWRTKSGPQDIVTAADTQAEELILREIRQIYPLDGILSEEDGLSPGTSGATWVVDPLDGTKNFAAGSPDFGVMISRMTEGRVQAAGIHLPAHGVVFSASAGAGARRNGVPFCLDGASPLNESLVDFSVVGEDGGFMEEQIQLLELLLKRSRGVRAVGSAKMFADVLDGTLAGACSFAYRHWDVVAPALIVTEAGGHACQLDGAPLNLSVSTARVDGERVPAIFGVPNVVKEIVRATSEVGTI